MSAIEAARLAPIDFFVKHQAPIPRVVITGIGVLCADGNTALNPSGFIYGREAYSNRIRSGQTVIGKTPPHILALYTDVDPIDSQVGAFFPEGFDPWPRDEHSPFPAIIPISTVKTLKEWNASLAAKLAAVASYGAVVDAGLIPDRLVPAETGAAISNSTGAIELIETAYREGQFRREAKSAEEIAKRSGKRKLAYAAIIGNGLSDDIVRIAEKVLRIRGYPINNVAACATSLGNIIAAADAIRLGHTSKILAGGAETLRSEVYINAFRTSRATAIGFNDTPELASRPGDIDRTGLVPAESAVVVLLERLADVKNDGREDKIVMEVLNGEAMMDVEGITISPHHEATSDASSRALARSGLAETGTDATFPHMTSTIDGDESEADAINKTNPHTIVYAGKSVTGHGLAVAGGHRVIEAAIAINDQKVPYSVNLLVPGTKDDKDQVNPGALGNIHWSGPKCQPEKIKTAALHGIGMEGINVVLPVVVYSRESPF